MASDNRFFQAVVEALSKDKLTLPTLPDVALRIRDVCESPDASAAAVAAELARDPAIAARVLRVANSAGQGATRRIESIQAAVARLGMQMTRLMVTSFAVEQTFACQSPELRMRLRSQWALSVEVAALSRVLASHFTVLKPDLAMLAGLTYDIGSLALIRAADQHKPAPAPDVLEEVLEQFGARVGRMVLQAWEFPAELREVPVHAADFHRWHDGPPDYADVVTVAMLQCDASGMRRWWSVDRASVPAFGRLDVGAGIEEVQMRELHDEQAEATQLLAA